MSEAARLLLGAEHACGYLSGSEARSAFIDPNFKLNPPRYGELLKMGFRRSGGYVYRPACAACNECKPVRVPVAEFTPSRTQLRCRRHNKDLSLIRGDALGEEHYALYRDYLAARHPTGGMDPEDRAAFHSFLECGWGRTEVWDFRRGPRLLASAIVDVLPRALSAVYTFFDPAESARSLGTFAVLTQIEQARSANLTHVYLGYWVEHSRKMTYKRNFRPLEMLAAQGWQRLNG